MQLEALRAARLGLSASSASSHLGDATRFTTPQPVRNFAADRVNTTAGGYAHQQRSGNSLDPSVPTQTPAVVWGEPSLTPAPAVEQTALRSSSLKAGNISQLNAATKRAIDRGPTAVSKQVGAKHHSTLPVGGSPGAHSTGSFKQEPSFIDKHEQEAAGQVSAYFRVEGDS